MKQRIHNSLFTVIMLLFLLVSTSVGAAAEEKTEDTKTVFYDYLDDQMAYGAQVAELIRQGEQTGKEGQAPSGAKRGEETGGQALFAVLCRAEDGFRPDFDKWAPACVVAGPQNRYTLFFRSEKDAAAACEGLAKTGGIRYAEPDAEVSACETGTTFHSWGATRMNYGEYVDYTGRWGSGSVTVAVIDSGVSRHPLLTDRIIPGGSDYIDGDHDSTSDENGHGTGVVADCTPGAAVMIYPIRVLDALGSGTTGNAANAVREATRAGVNVIKIMA